MRNALSGRGVAGGACTVRQALGSQSQSPPPSPATRQPPPGVLARPSMPAFPSNAASGRRMGIGREAGRASGP